MSFSLLLENINKYISLSEEEKKYFTALLQWRKIRKKQFVVQEGDINKYGLFVNEGCLKSYAVDKNGYEHVLQFAPAGWWINDMTSFIKQETGTLNIDAVYDSEILMLSYSDQQKLFNNIPQFERFFRILAERSLAAYQHRLINTLSLPAIERYNNFCTLYPTLITSLPQKLVASYIGVTPEFLSKMLNQRYSPK